MKRARRSLSSRARRMAAAGLFAAVAGGLLVSLTEASAQGYPSRPIKFVIPFPPGGSTDISGRLLATEMSSALGQPVVVENRPGAAGAIGVDAVAKSAPDGYTMGLSGTGPTILLHIIGPKPPYTLKDLAIVGHAGLVEFMILGRPSLPQNTIRELIQAARANPGKTSFGTSGGGGPGHLAFEYLQALADVQLIHVPYKGDSPILNDLMGNQLDLGILTVTAALSQVKAGKVKPIAMATATRSPLFPDLPTVAESGVPGYEAGASTMLVVAAGTPAPIVMKLNEALNESLRKPMVREKFIALGLTPVPGTPEAAAESVRRDTEKWSKVIRDAKITAAQ